MTPRPRGRHTPADVEFTPFWQSGESSMPQAKRECGGRVRILRSVAAAAGLLALLVFGSIGWAGDKGGKKPKQPLGVAIAGEEKGTLLTRRPSEKSWRVAAPRSALQAGELLMALPGFVAKVGTGKTNQPLRLELIGNLPGLFRAQSLESRVTLQSAKGTDLDINLERGRILLSHVGKKGGTARCRVRFGNASWDIDLSEPGSSVVLDLNVHRLAWTDFPKKPDPKLQPSLNVNLIVLAGSVDLAEARVRQTLVPMSSVHWTSEAGTSEVTLLKELPAELKRSADANAKKVLTAVRELQGRLAKGTPGAVLQDALRDKVPQIRTAAVYGLGAIGEIDTVLKALGDAKHADVREAAVNELRYWVGQSYQGDQRIYTSLLAQKYMKPHAEILVKLLHSFTPRQLTQPETYEALIHYLSHDRLAIRQLAAWQLHSLVPGADQIAYDPAGTPAQLREGQARWRKRIPEGKIPSAPQK
jgi:hypothetical protein